MNPSPSMSDVARAAGVSKNAVSLAFRGDWQIPERTRVRIANTLIQYEWRDDAPDWPGLKQHNDLAGQAAVDMLVGMIHRGEKGPPPFPMATLISPTWVEARGPDPEPISRR